ncbi:MAG: hypothetical protein ACK4I0_01195 [Brevundimonas sp.]|uniref:hypothetical protein n=1 Tax=Brevundimonas sp. TaxID=1871086 RepID=UPI00391B669C
MVYRFVYYYAGAENPVQERHECVDDATATQRGAAELLRAPSRDAVDVWADARLVYQRRRRGPPARSA